MATYSIGTAPTNADKLADLQSVLNVLPDNTQKLISPLDVRSAVYTLWENIIFKPTTAGGTEYIGIDKSDFVEKIFIGKKTNSGQFVMNNNLLNTDVDVFFYNTKSTANYDTKVAFLAGTSSFVVSGQVSAPYVEALKVTNPGYDNTINFQIINPSYYNDGTTNLGGDINIKSNHGDVSLNGLIFPKYSVNNTGLGYDGYVLKYRWIGGLPYAVWEAGSTVSLDSLFSTGTVSITGSPVLINGLNVNFTSLVPVPEDLGGITAGMTFSDVPVTEMIRMLLYPYIAPTLLMTPTNEITEIGNTFSVPLLNYTITRGSSYSITSLAFSLGTIYSPPDGPDLVNPASIGTGVTTGYVRPIVTSIQFPTNPTTAWTQSTWTLNLSDGLPTTVTASVTLTTTLPWYYGTATSSRTTGSSLTQFILGTNSNPIYGKLTPLITTPALTASSVYNKSLTLSGNGVYVYFGYPSVFPDLYEILDQNDFDVTGSFTKFTITGVSSPVTPSPRWTNRSYKFYIYTGPTSSTPQTTTLGTTVSNYSAIYKFNFA